MRELEKWIGKALFEVDLGTCEALPQTRSIPRWIWGIIGFAGGYFTAALVGALYWGWLP